MPSLDVDENIKRIQQNIEHLQKEVCRFEGMLQTFIEFKKCGLTTIELPKSPEELIHISEPLEKIEEESTQENPE